MNGRREALLGALVAAGDWLDAATLADRTGKRSLSQNDKLRLQELHTDGLIAIEKAPAPGPKGWKFIYRAINGDTTKAQT